MLIRFLVRVLLGMAFLLSLFRSVQVTVAWSQGRLVPDAVDLLWILALPILVWVYLRYFSVLACTGSCDTAEPGRRRDPR